MKIAHFTDNQCKGGAETTLLELALYQKKQGHDVSIIHHQNDYLAKSCENYGLRELRIPRYDLFKSIYTLPLYAFWLYRYLVKFRFDVLHSHLFGSITGNALACYLLQIRHVGTLHDVYMVEDRPSLIWLLKLSLLFKTELICVSNDMADYYRKRLGFLGKSVQVNRNGVLISEAVPKGEADSLRDSLGMSASTKALIAVGRLVPLKRVDKIIKSFSLINVESKRLIILGDGPERKPLMDLIYSLGEEDNVLMLGEVTDVDKYLSLADVFIQFSETEGLSKSILEAMASGLPCIVSDVGGNSELVREGFNGSILPISIDDEELSVKIFSILMDSTIKLSMSRNSKEFVASEFSYENYQQRYVQIYESIK